MVTYTSGIFRAGLGFLINTILARTLGPSDFGLYFFFITTVILLHALIGEAMDSAMVRYHSDSHANEKSKVRSVVGSAVVLRMGIAFPVLLLGLAGATNFSVMVFDTEEHAGMIRLACLTAVLLAFFNLALAILQAKELFFVRAVLFPLVNLIRLPVIVFLLLGAYLTLDWIYWSYLSAAAIAVIVSLWIVRADFSCMKFDREICWKIAHLAKWNLLIFGSHLVLINLAVPVLTNVSGSESAGYFAAAATLTIFVEQAISAILITILPKVSKLQSQDEMFGFIRSTFPRYVLAAMVLAPIALLGELFIKLIYGDGYLPSIPVFQIIYIGSLLNVIAQPIGLLFFTSGKANLLACFSVLSAVIWCAGAWFLISPYCEIGAAVAILIARFSFLLLVLVAVFVVFYRRSFLAQK